MNQILFLISIIVIATFGILYSFNRSSNDNNDIKTEEITRYHTQLQGTYVCLRDVKSTVSKSDDCDYGIKTDNNEYYAVDFNLLSQVKPDLNQGDRFSAKGVVTPIEMISTDYWQKYGIKGIFSVTDSVSKL